MNILGVGAHPDDLDFSAAGSFARWAREGHNCYYLICTDGRKGSDDPKMTEDRLIEIRKQEQIAAGKILGIKEVVFLGHRDTELVTDLNLKREITAQIRKFKPDTVVSLDPTFYYSVERGFVNHTDHRAAGAATLDAVFPLARDRLTFPELEKDQLTPHKVKTLLMVNFDNANFGMDISDTLNLKISALKAHTSQISEEAIKRSRTIAETTGKKFGFKYGEGFIKLTLPA
jgi:LmbE family N-acetylglucosaminyl deacetylase